MGYAPAAWATFGGALAGVAGALTALVGLLGPPFAVVLGIGTLYAYFGAVDALQVDRGDPEIGVTELALDHKQGHTFTSHLDGVCVPELVRREASADARTRSGLAELGACWLLLYSVEVGLAEAYTLPFAAVALLMGAIEQRRRRDLSSWLAYGPALAGTFLPSLALIVVGEDPVWRWVTVFVVAVAIVIVGSWRRLQAPALAGAAVAVVVAVTEMIRLLAAGQIFGAVLVALGGAILVLFGAISETRRRSSRRP